MNVQLRATDSKEFGEIADALNKATATIRTQVAEAKSEVAHLKELQNSPAANASDINVALENCENALDYFKAERNQADSSAN